MWDDARWAKLQQWADDPKTNGLGGKVDPLSLEGQLNFVVWELKNKFPDTYALLRTTKTVEAATRAFECGLCIPGNTKGATGYLAAGKPQMPARICDARRVLRAFDGLNSIGKCAAHGDGF